LKKVLIDTDPGTDDALAMMMALNAPELDVLGFTTVGGNARLADTTRNALRLLEYLGRTDVPVFRGSARPLRGSFQYAYNVHGAAGLGVRLPSPLTAPRARRAPQAITEMASAHRGELTVIALGPLTNIARALALEPRVAVWIKQMVVMGGAVEAPGNVTPHAEFNIYNDPAAADVVLSSGIPVTLVGLDVTGLTYLTAAAGPWVRGDSPAARLSRRILAGSLGPATGLGRFHLHDPLAVAAAIRPGLFTYEQAAVAVETSDSAQAGRTVASYGGGPVAVAVGVDVARAKAMTVELLGVSI
jgi:inosine-uridine nucleoside N-ribohydrolase